MNLFPLYFCIGVILFIISIPVYFYYDEKRYIKTYEENQKKYNDPNYKKKKEEEFEESLKTKCNDTYYISEISETSSNHTKSINDDSLNNIMDTSCPYNIWTWD